MKQKKCRIAIILIILLTVFASSAYAYEYYYCPRCMTNTCIAECSGSDTGYEYEDYHMYYVGSVLTRCEIMREEYYTDGHCDFCSEVVSNVSTHIHYTSHEKCGASGNVCPYN